MVQFAVAALSERRKLLKNQDRRSETAATERRTDPLPEIGCRPVLLELFSKIRELLFQVGDFLVQGCDFIFQAGDALGVG